MPPPAALCSSPSVVQVCHMTDRPDHQMGIGLDGGVHRGIVGEVGQTHGEIIRSA